MKRELKVSAIAIGFLFALVGNPVAAEILLSKGTTLHFVAEKNVQEPSDRDALQSLPIAIVPAGIRMATTGRSILIDGVGRHEVVTERGIMGYLRENPKGDNAAKHYWTEEQFIWFFRTYKNIVVINQVRKNLEVIGKDKTVKISPAEVYLYVDTEDGYFVAKPVSEIAAELKDIKVGDAIRIPLEAASLLTAKDNIKAIRSFFSAKRYVAIQHKFKNISLYKVSKISKRCGATSVATTVNNKKYTWKAGVGLSIGGASGPLTGSTSFSAALGSEVSARIKNVVALPENLNVLRKNFGSLDRDAPYEITRNQKCIKQGNVWKSLDDKYYSLRDSDGDEIELDLSRIANINREIVNTVSLNKNNGRILLRCMSDYLGLMKALKARAISPRGSNLLLIHATQLRNYRNLSKCQ